MGYRKLTVVALLAACLYGVALPSNVAGEGIGSVIKMKAIEQSVSTPLELFWKDVWDVIFHRQGNKYWKNMYFLLGRLSKYKKCRDVSIIIMFELRRSLFKKGEGYNKKTWAKLEKEFEKHLREWWLQNPLDPYASLDVGVWRCLVKLYSSWLEPNMRGSNKLKVLETIIFDPKLTVVKRWTDDAHTRLMKGKGSKKEKIAALEKMKHLPILEEVSQELELSETKEDSKFLKSKN